MASKKPENDSKKDQYKPKATARHAKIVKTKQEEIDDFKAKIANDKYLAKKYEAKRKEEIKALPKEERREAMSDLRESIQTRKEAERKDKEILRDMISGERESKRAAKGDAINENEWIKGGRKKGSSKNETTVAPTAESVSDDVPTAGSIPDTAPEVESAVDPATEPGKEDIAAEPNISEVPDKESSE
jgi:Predicted membrane protein